jgi:hypothetical protein
MEPHQPDQQVVQASSTQDADQGQAAAARKNRETQTRQQIVRALQSLGKHSGIEWPDFIRDFCRVPSEQTEFTDCAILPPFQPPDFDRLNQSPEDWAKTANAAWEQHRDRFLQSCQAWVAAGVDEEIPAAKKVREPGIERGARGKNAAMVRRYSWAAKYVMRVPLKEIAAQDHADVATVGRVARATLRQAGWLESARVKRRASGV